MRIRAIKWTVFSLIMIILLLFLCALTVYIVDPFEHYRESAIYPLYDQESYNNPGIARNYDYNAVILGTSMIEMSLPSVIDECFDVSSVKLPMRGSYTAQMGWQLSHVLSKRNLDLAILEVDAYSLQGRPNDDEEIVTYLWDDDPINDISYLLNLDVLLCRVPEMLKNRGKSLDHKRDEMYQWTDVVFAKESVLSAVHFMAQKEMMPADTRIERAEENIRLHLESQIAAHPETRFIVYMPPYSVGYWYQMTREGISEQQYLNRDLLCEILLPYENVEIYDFSSRIEWIESLDEYFDYSHHSTKISNEIMHAIVRGENRVFSPEEMEEGNLRIREAVNRFAEEYEPR